VYNALEANVERGSSVHPSGRILLVGYLLSHDRSLPINNDQHILVIHAENVV